MESASTSSDESGTEVSTNIPRETRDVTSGDTASSDQQANEDPSLGPTRSSAQKRRRVTRACDECRRKKIKCDGKQPCTHCTVYSYECTYDQPSHRRRNHAPQYIEALEKRLGRAEAVIRIYLPNLDWNDPTLDQMIRQQQESMPPISRSQFGRNLDEKGLDRTSSNDPALESMVEATGQLDIDETGRQIYSGDASGLTFVRGVRDRLYDLEQPQQTEEKSKIKRQTGSSQIRVPSPPPYVGEDPVVNEPPFDTTKIGPDQLPSKELAHQLCISALDDATAILKLVHQPSFYFQFNRIYEVPPEDYTNDDRAFLPLLYAVIALGCLFATDPQSDLELNGYRSAISIGNRYFRASRQLLDLTDCRDLTSLQTVVFLIMFVQSSSKLATCYSFVGIALRSALRMGLHRSLKDTFDPIQGEIRKRVFWTIRKMDIHVGAMLGMPQTVNDEDIDQEYPTEVDDEFITANKILPMPEGRTALMCAVNANFRLSKILCKIMRSIYPVKGHPNSDTGSSKAYSVTYAKIKELEMDLQRWEQSLPPQLKSGGDESPQHTRQQQLLRMGYAHAQLTLYKPFLHYISARNHSKPVNQRGYACALSCVSVSRNIVHITAEMKRQGLMEGSYWFTVYTTFFGVLVLVFFVVENPNDPTCPSVIQDAKEGKETLARLARRSMAADRCMTTLNALFELVGQTLEKMATGDISSHQKRESVSGNAAASWEMAKNASKGSGSSSSAGGHRGGTANRQRGMRMISQTGRPNSQKQHPSQLRASTQPQNVTQVHRPQPQLHPQQQAQPLQQQIPIHPQHHSSSMPPANVYVPAMAGDSTTITANSSSFSTPLQQSQTLYEQQPPSFIPTQLQDAPYTESMSNFSNFSNMMFPSDNPFQYPNQPITTLEQNIGLDRDGAYGSQQFSPQEDVMFSTNSTSAMTTDDRIDAQQFGPFPPYLSQQQNAGSRNPSVIEGAAENAIEPGSGAQGQFFASSGMDMWNQQARSQGLPHVSLDDIFADDEWHGAEQ